MTQANSTQKKSKTTQTPVRQVETSRVIVTEGVGTPDLSKGERRKRLAWDMVGLLLLVVGAVLLLGVLGLTRGQVVDVISAIIRRLFGFGRFVIPLFFFFFGWKLFQWRRDPGSRVHIWRLVLVELGFFAALAATSAFYGDTVNMVNAGTSAGGVVGWGLADPLLDFVGWLPTGMIIGILGLGMLLVGFNLAGRVETWAINKSMARAEPHESMVESHAYTPVASPDTSQITTETTPEIKKKEPQEPRKSKKPAGQPALPLEYTRKRSAERAQKQTEGTLERSEDLPPLSLLEPERLLAVNQATIDTNSALIEKTLEEFGIPAKVVSYRVGPTVTQYAVEPGYKDKGDEKLKVRISQISALNRDLALALKAQSLRIEAPVPGESYVGIEVPNPDHSIVRLRPIMESDEFKQSKSPLTIPLGRDVSGLPLVSDLSRMPHLLIAGTTNSGKSICIAAITTCLVMNNKPEDLRLVMIDPKMVELTRFNGLPHLLGKVETDVNRIMKVLKWATEQMEIRYQLLEAMHARDLDTYNQRVARNGGSKLYRVVILIDELADLMMTASSETEEALTRLAQKARAVGIHLVVATQRPSTNVVTGVIKANFPTRIAFMVASSVDSHVILDSPGAENLLGRGDMLFSHPEIGSLVRSQGVFVNDHEIQQVINWWRERSYLPTEPALEASTEPAEAEAEPEPEPTSPPWENVVREDAEEDEDETLIQQATTIIRKDKIATASYLQRQLHTGYAKAAWLMDQLEARGVIGPAQSGGKKREIFEDESEDDTN